MEEIELNEYEFFSRIIIMIIIGLLYLPMCMQQTLSLIVFVFSVKTHTHTLAKFKHYN